MAMRESSLYLRHNLFYPLSLSDKTYGQKPVTGTFVEAETALCYHPY